MIIHISRERFDNIRKQGFAFQVDFSFAPCPTDAYRTGDTYYHLLNAEHGYCAYCGERFDSIQADTPAELETVKHLMRENQMADIEDEKVDGNDKAEFQRLLNEMPVWISCNGQGRVDHVEDIWHPPPFQRPDLVITPAADQTVRVKFSKAEHEIEWGAENEDTAELIIKPLVKE